MEGIDPILLLKELLHSAPFLGILLWMGKAAMKRHEDFSNKTSKTLHDIEISLASANFPQMQNDISGLKQDVARHDAILFGPKPPKNGSLRDS